MANCVWETIMQNGWFQEIKHLYGKDFPWEIRSTLSIWLARDDSFMSFDPNEPAHHQYIFGFITQLIAELENITQDQSSQGDAYFVYKQRLIDLLKRMKAQNWMHLFQVIRNTLACEKQKVEELSSVGSNISNPVSTTARSVEKSFAQIQEEIDSALLDIEGKYTIIDQSVPQINQRFTTWQYNVYMYQQRNGSGNESNGYIDSMNTATPTTQDLQSENTAINQDIQLIYNVLDEVMRKLTSVHSRVLNELETWRDEQRLVALGKPGNNMLDSIEKWFKMMANCFASLELQLPVYKSICQTRKYTNEFINNIQGALDKVESLRQNMIDVSLVISKEPKQIIRTGPNFGPVYLLVLPFCSNMMITSKEAAFINSKTALEFYTGSDNKHQKPPTKSADLKFGKGVPAKVTGNKIEYQTLTVSKVLKNAKRGEQFVVEERFWIYFKVTVNWQGRTTILNTTSLPISVTSHPVQEGKAWTHVLWYNAFPVNSRIQRFQVPEEIPCNWLIEAINLNFINLGKGLSNDQKCYLKDKLFRGEATDDGMVSKSRFCCETFITGRVDADSSEDGNAFIKNYTFGEWLFCCLKILSWAPKNGKLAKYGLKHFWREGKIEGFMSKEKLETLLKGTPSGTFIIRFPENMPDSISLYFYNYSANTREKLLKQLYTIKDFNFKALQDRILDSPLTTYLYPKVEKEKAFTRMSKSETAIVDGYFTVGMQEDIPSQIEHSLKISGDDQSVPSPISSHSLLSNLSRYMAPSPAESYQSDSSNTTGFYTSPGPVSSTTNNWGDDLSQPSLWKDGIEAGVLQEDETMDLAWL